MCRYTTISMVACGWMGVGWVFTSSTMRGGVVVVVVGDYRFNQKLLELNDHDDDDGGNGNVTDMQKKQVHSQSKISTTERWIGSIERTLNRVLMKNLLDKPVLTKLLWVQPTY